VFSVLTKSRDGATVSSNDRREVTTSTQFALLGSGVSCKTFSTVQQHTLLGEGVLLRSDRRKSIQSVRVTTGDRRVGPVGEGWCGVTYKAEQSRLIQRSTGERLCAMLQPTLEGKCTVGITTHEAAYVMRRLTDVPQTGFPINVGEPLLRLRNQKTRRS